MTTPKPLKTAPQPSDRASTRVSRYAKSADTENKIISAAIDQLYEQGYGAISLQKVAKRAGVTRGCAQYYVKTLDDLLIGVQGVLIDRLWGDFLERARDIPEGDDRLERCLDMVLSLADSRYFQVWNELLQAARTNPQLEGVVLMGAERLEQIHHALFQEFHPNSKAGSREQIRAMDDLFVMVMHALPLVRFSGDSDQRKARSVALLKAAALQVFVQDP